MTAENLRHSSLVLFLLSAMTWMSCDEVSPTRKPENSTTEILNADKAFSDMSRQIGMKKAFLQYIDNEGTLLRPDRLPLTGAAAIDHISVLNDTGYNLSWHPMRAEIASSGELGYTFGIYRLKMPDTTLSGTYVTIWKKEIDGEWKFVLNSNNPGIYEPGEDLP